MTTERFWASKKPSDRNEIAAQRLRQKRKSYDMMIKELSEDSGIAIKTISDIENGRRGMSVESAIRLAKALAVRPEWLLALDMVEV